jgi:wobble nucleotide-excising tRNase
MTNTKMTLFLFFAFLTLPTAFESGLVAMAGENMETQVQNSGTDMKTATKKNIRKLKRGARKATGQDSAAKDLGDHVNDSVDNVKGSLEKVSH